MWNSWHWVVNHVSSSNKLKKKRNQKLYHFCCHVFLKSNSPNQLSDFAIFKDVPGIGDICSLSWSIATKTRFHRFLLLCPPDHSKKNISISEIKRNSQFVIPVWFVSWEKLHCFFSTSMVRWHRPPQVQGWWRILVSDGILDNDPIMVCSVETVLKGQLGVPLAVYPLYLLCSLGILGDCNP